MSIYRKCLPLALLAFLVPALGFAQSILNFPRVISSDAVFTGLAVSNPTAIPASVTFTAIQSDGTVMAGNGVQNPVTVSIPAGGEVSQLVREIFSMDEPFNGWVQAASAAYGLQGHSFNSSVSLTDMEGAGAVEPSSDFILPFGFEDGQARTEVSIVNVNTEPASIRLTLFAADGAILGVNNVILPRHGLLRQTIGGIFGGIDYSAASHVRIQADRQVVGQQSVTAYLAPGSTVRRETAAFEGQVLDSATVHVIPQFVSGAGWLSLLGIVNGAGVSQEVTISAYDNDGVLWPGTSNPRRIVLSGNGGIHISVESLFGFPPDEIRTGWIEIKSSLGFIASYAGYGSALTPSFLVSRGLISAYAARTTMFAHAAESATLFTGITILNAGTVPSAVEVFVFRPDGSAVGRTAFTIGPRQRIGGILRDIIPATLDMVGGWTLVRSAQPIVAAMLFGTADGRALANIPGQSLTADFVPRAQTSASITGTVEQQAAGIAGVSIALSGPVTLTATTDATGRFIFSQLPPGKYFIRASRIGAQFSPAEHAVALESENVDVKFEVAGLAPASPPLISIISPASSFVGTGDVNLTIIGTNFNPASVAYLNGSALATMYVSASELRAIVPAGSMLQPAVLELAVTTPPPGGGISATLPFTVHSVPQNALIEGRITVGSFPAGVAIHPAGTTGVVTNESSDSVSILDLSTKRKIAEIKVGRSPAEGVAIHPELNIALVGNVGSNDLSVIDLTGLRVIKTIAVGKFPIGVAINTNTNRAVVVNGDDGDVSVIDLDSLSVIQNIRVESRPASVAINSRTNHAVVTNRGSSTITVIDLANGEVQGSVKVGAYPRGIAINEDTNQAVVANANEGTATVIDLARLSVLGTVPVGNGPTAVAIHKMTNNALVTNSGFVRGAGSLSAVSTVSIINLDQREVIATVPVGSTAFGVAVESEGSLGLVANFGSNDVTILHVPNPTPSVTDVTPRTFPVGVTAFTATIRGHGFLPTSVVTLNGQALPTIYMSSSELRCEIQTKILAAMAQGSRIEQAEPNKRNLERIEPQFNIGVRNPAPGGGSSAPPSDPGLARIIPENPAPVLVSVSPAEAEVGSGELTIALHGMNLISASMVHFDGVPYSPDTVSPQMITVRIPRAALSRARRVEITVTNPAPRGGTTGAIAFVITEPRNPAPWISELSPSSVVAGSSATSFTISGHGFISLTAVSINGTAIPASVSQDSLSFNVSASLLRSSGVLSGVVTNPGPGGGTASFTVSVLNAPPVITGFAPRSVSAESAGVALTVNGSGFGSQSVITIEGVPIETSLTGPGELAGVIPAGLLRQPGTLKLAVVNRPPGGGIVEAGILTVTPVRPSIRSLLPAVARVQRTPLLIEIVGVGFGSGSRVFVDGKPLDTNVESSQRIHVMFPANFFAQPGVLSVVVRNSGPGGDVSDAANFVVEAETTINTTPILRRLNPSIVTMDESIKRIVVEGAGFVEKSIVLLDGKEVHTAVVSASELVFEVPRSTRVGTVVVSVFNPPPGGGTSNPLVLTVRQIPSCDEVDSGNIPNGFGVTGSASNGNRQPCVREPEETTSGNSNGQPGTREPINTGSNNGTASGNSGSANGSGNQSGSGNAQSGSGTSASGGNNNPPDNGGMSSGSGTEPPVVTGNNGSANSNPNANGGGNGNGNSGSANGGGNQPGNGNAQNSAGTAASGGNNPPDNGGMSSGSGVEPPAVTGNNGSANGNPNANGGGNGNGNSGSANPPDNGGMSSGSGVEPPAVTGNNGSANSNPNANGGGNGNGNSGSANPPDNGGMSSGSGVEPPAVTGNSGSANSNPNANGGGNGNENSGSASGGGNQPGNNGNAQNSAGTSAGGAGNNNIPPDSGVISSGPGGEATQGTGNNGSGNGTTPGDNNGGNSGNGRSNSGRPGNDDPPVPGEEKPGKGNGKTPNIQPDFN